MEKLDELTKEELRSLVINALPNLFIDIECLECAACGQTADAKYYYICDRCNEALTKERGGYAAVINTTAKEERKCD